MSLSYNSENMIMVYRHFEVDRAHVRWESGFLDVLASPFMAFSFLKPFAAAFVEVHEKHVLTHTDTVFLLGFWGHLQTSFTIYIVNDINNQIGIKHHIVTLHTE